MSESEVDYTKVFVEIALKFFVGQADDELNNDERLYFVLERAHWYFIDFHPSANNMTFVKFCDKFLVFLNLNSARGLAQQFSKYKRKVPVYGALILSADQSKILMVKGFHKLSRYTFPKGKLGYKETGKLCAIREVYEEVGYNVSENISDYFFRPENEKYTLFLVPGISTDVKFCPKTRNEIKEIRWIDIKYLQSEDIPDEYLYGRKVIENVKNFLNSIPYTVLSGKSDFKFDREQLRNALKNL